MNKINYNKKMMQQIEQITGEGQRPSLLLHSCCAPCSSACVEALRTHFDLTVFYFNPNITEAAEYDKRRREQQRFLRAFAPEVKYLEGAYVPDSFFAAVQGLEDCPEGGARCMVCYRQRLEETARTAKEHGFDWFCTTLTLSPLKDAQKLNAIGTEVGRKWGVPFLPSDFKKAEGYKRSLILSKEYGLYRQNYCGCIFSKRGEENA